jgi:hypothetical protein
MSYVYHDYLQGRIVHSSHPLKDEQYKFLYKWTKEEGRTYENS